MVKVPAGALVLERPEDVAVDRGITHLIAQVQVE